MELWCEIMFSCSTPFRTTWPEQDEYDVDDPWTGWCGACEASLSQDPVTSVSSSIQF